MNYIDPFIVDNVDTQSSSKLKIRNTQMARVVFDFQQTDSVSINASQSVVVNPLSHMTAKQRISEIAKQIQLYPDAPALYSPGMSSLHTKVYIALKQYYLAAGHTSEQWFDVASNHHTFNQVWRKSLMLPPGNSPPPEQWRFVIPFNPKFN